jgi:hypothetical protein
MDLYRFFRRGIWFFLLVLLLASPVMAQIEDHLSAYTGENAEGYLDPLIGAIGATMNSGLHRSAHIPRTGFTVSLEFPIIGLYFADDDGIFTATTESGFTPQQKADAPTVIGPTEAVTVEGDGGTTYAFPGGFDVGSFTFTAPQLRIGSAFGTEAMIRFIALKIGDNELGDLSLFGLGVRHNFNQYFRVEPPVDLSASFFWQSFKLGENESGSDLFKTNAYSFGIQASRHIPPFLTPYTGLYYNSYTTDISYESEAGGEEESIDLSFDDGYVQWTIGIELNAAFLDLFVEYNVASRSSFAFGLGLGM